MTDRLTVTLFILIPTPKSTQPLLTFLISSCVNIYLSSLSASDFFYLVSLSFSPIFSLLSSLTLSLTFKSSYPCSPHPFFCHLPTSHQLAFVIVSNIFLLLAISGKDCLCFLFLGLNIKFRLIVSCTNSSHLMFPEHLVYSGTGDSTFLPNTYR